MRSSALPLDRSRLLPIRFVAAGAKRHAMRYTTDWAQNHRLDAIETMEGFWAYVEERQPEEFLMYRDLSAQKREEYERVVNAIGIGLRDSTVLDLGPGYGDALDVAIQRGARRADFVELDPYFYAYNRLKSVGRAYRMNLNTELGKLEAATYDMIHLKGSISADSFMHATTLTRLSRWIEGLERLLAPTGTAVICPHWSASSGRRLIDDALGSPLSVRLTELGYSMLHNIERHNDEPNYPVTYVKRRTGH